MPVAPSFEDLVDQGIAQAQALRPRLQFFDGDIAQAQIHGAAAMNDAAIRFSAQAFKATFIDGAVGDELTTLVDDHYNIQRNPATQAQAQVEFTRPSQGGGEPAGVIPTGTIVATDFDADGEQIQFTTDADVVWGLGELGPKTVQVTAVLEGRDGNVEADSIVQILDVPGFDSTFAVTNPARAGGGNDEESDEALRTRARNFFLTLRRGTLASLEFGALTVDSVRVAKAVEDVISGIATVRVSDEDGNSTLQMISDVVAELEDWRCAGSTVVVVGGVQLAVSMDFTLVVREGYDVAAFSSLLSDAVTNRLSKLKVGETMYLDSVIAAIIAVAPDDILEVTFDTITTNPGGAQPIADLVPTSSQVIRGDAFTFTV